MSEELNEQTHTAGAADPYDEPIFIRSHIRRLSHMHSEPVCAFPECETYLTRDDIRAMRARVTPLAGDER